jgi:ketosteroid isomerase-like protein
MASGWETGFSIQEAAMAGVRDEITEAYKAFEENFFKGDADALSLIYTDDAELLVPEAPPIKGRAAIAQAWRGFIGSGGNRVRVEVREVQDNGDWAFEVGSFTASAHAGALLNSGKYIVIWKRQSNGTWKTCRDIFNWNIPPRPE